MAQLWGRLRVPHPENPLDKQIAATALMHDLVVVTRNTAHFEATGARSVGRPATNVVGLRLAVRGLDHLASARLRGLPARGQTSAARVPSLIICSDDLYNRG